VAGVEVGPGLPARRDRTTELYGRLRKAQASDLRAPAVSKLLEEILRECRQAIKRYKRVPLSTPIPGKRYFAFEGSRGKISRAVNTDLFHPRFNDWQRVVRALGLGDFQGLTEQDITRTVYSAAMSFCVVIDLTRKGDQKTPATYFEYLIGHLFARRLGVGPMTRLDVLNLGLETKLPTDYVFDLGIERPKFHLPIKTSTRERVIQVWAHQRVLDGVYGTGRFLGTPVIMAETKTDSKTRTVTEICLPLQWRLYQMHISQLRRVYYLDVPAAYAALTNVFPPIHVAPFGRFFIEADELVKV
jgi:hypothetical protein